MMRTTTILAYLIALVGLVLIAAGARDSYLLSNEETFEVTLSDYETPIRTIAGGLAMIGLAQALRLLRMLLAASITSTASATPIRAA